MRKTNDFTRLTRRGAMATMGAALAMPLYARYAGAAETTLRMHHFMPPVSTTHTKMFVPWADTIREKTDGKVEVQVFPSMQMGGRPPELFDQARNGVVDISFTVAGYTPGRFAVAEAIGLPFNITTAERASVAMQTVMEKHGLPEYSEVKPLGFWVHSPGILHMRNAVITDQAGIAGKKIRVPSQQMAELVRNLGGEPVFMPITEIAVSISNGVVDGACLPYETIRAFKLDELAPHHSGVASGGRGIYTTAFALAMNKRKFDSLSPDVQDVLNAETGMGLSQRFGAMYDGFGAAGLENAKNRGNEIGEISLEEAARWREAAAPIRENYIKTLNEKGVDGQDVFATIDDILG